MSDNAEAVRAERSAGLSVAVPRPGPAENASRRICSAFLIAALVSLAIGGAGAVIIALVRAPALGVSISPAFYYRILTLHGLAMFYHWFLFLQGALLFAAVGIYIPGARIASVAWGWLAFAAMAGGALLQQAAALTGGAVLYTAFPPMSGQFPRSSLVYLGFILLAVGVALLSMNYMATIAFARRSRLVFGLPTPAYVGLVWAIVMITASTIAIAIYLPALLWSAGLGPVDPMDYMMGYFTYFHVNHYAPLIATVGIWYALAKHTTGAQSIFGERFSKGVFTIYPVVVPPTFLYHLFLAPGVPGSLKTAGSILSAFVGVPTLIVSVVVVGMLEARMRALGSKGPVQWLRLLPWGNPAFGSLIMGMATCGLGGAFAYALLSEGLAPLLHNTFVVPGYFHAFTSAGVTLTFMGALYALLPALSGRQLSPLALARVQPYLMAAGATVFVLFGVAAGYAGVPRRVSGIDYGGGAPSSWSVLMNVTMGAGALLMVVAGTLFFTVVVMTLLAGRPVIAAATAPEPGTDRVAGVETAPMNWFATMPAVLVAVMIAGVSIVSFEVMQRWPFEVR